MRLKPAAPPVDRSTIWTDTVKRGPLVRQVRSSTGVLAPREDSIELIPAQTEATVVRIRILPGAQVTPDTVIMDLADPQLQQELLNARLALKAAEADYKSLQAQLESTLMDKKTSAAQVNADYTQDQLQAQTDKALFDLGVISGLAYQKSKNTADQLTAQHQLSQQQLAVNEKAVEVQLASQKTKIDQAQALLDLRRCPYRCRWASTCPREPAWPRLSSATSSRLLCRLPRRRRATYKSASRPPSTRTTASFPDTLRASILR
jgi:hypothetical protein